MPAPAQILTGLCGTSPTHLPRTLAIREHKRSSWREIRAVRGHPRSLPIKKSHGLNPQGTGSMPALHTTRPAREQ